MNSVLFELELLRPEVRTKLLKKKQLEALTVNTASCNLDDETVAKNPLDTKDREKDNDRPPTPLGFDRRGSQGMRSILLKGQMRYVADINAIIFLCSPL